jgi:hypothetical protein
MNEIITSKHERRELQKWSTNDGVACKEEVIETETKW